MLRLVSIPAIVLLVRQHEWTAVVWLFAAGAFTDVLDGVVARAFHLETSVGALLDPVTDIAFNSSIFIALSREGVVPWWVTGLIVARYALLVGGTVYLYLFHGPVRIQPTLFGKLTGLLTTILLGFLLLGLSLWSEGTQHRLKEVFDVGLGVMGLATIIQVVFIGFANRNLMLEPSVEAERPAVEQKVLVDAEPRVELGLALEVVAPISGEKDLQGPVDAALLVAHHPPVALAARHVEHREHVGRKHALGGVVDG
jgi:cardiolipin synthase